MSTQPEALRLADALLLPWPNVAPLHPASAELRRLHELNQELVSALKKADDFIDGIREDLHHERIADWYPEGAHNSAESMSESMRLIGNRCADFDVASAAIAKAEGTPT